MTSTRPDTQAAAPGPQLPAPFLAALDALETGFALADDSCAIIDSNAAFRQMFGDQAGAMDRIRREGGASAREALDGAIGSRQRTVAPIRADRGCGTVILHFVPLEAPWPGGTLLVAKPEPREVQIPVEWLIEAFRLAPREAEIGQLLVRGRDIQQIADELDIAVTTARVHLRNIFRKTRTGRQSSLLTVLVRTLMT